MGPYSDVGVKKSALRSDFASRSQGFHKGVADLDGQIDGAVFLLIFLVDDDGKFREPVHRSDRAVEPCDDRV